MRGMLLTILLIIFLSIAFGFGAANTQAAPMLLAACGFPFVLIGLGWTAHAWLGGRRLALVTSERRQSPAPNGNQRRRSTTNAPALSSDEAHTL